MNKKTKGGVGERSDATKGKGNTKKSSAKKRSGQKQGSAVWRWVRYALVIAQMLVSVALVVPLISMNILDILWVVLVTAVLFGLVIFSMLTLISKRQRKWAQVASVAIATVSIVGCVMALRYTGAINGFLNKVTEQRIETKEYSVAVLEKSEINEVQELAGKSVGFLSTDMKAGNASEYLQSVVGIESDFYDNMETLAEVLNNQISAAIVLETERLQAMIDEGRDTLENTRVIYTFEIETDSEDVEISKKKVTEEPFVVYISGSDSRHGVKAAARSDVNIVAVVNPAKGKILLVSIPRDMYVQLHGTTGLKDKLTHAGIYGIDMSRETIEDFLGAEIDHTIKVSFDTVVQVVDQLDGVEIDSDTAMKLKVEGKDKYCEYKIGVQTVDGDCALRFARERKSYETGDRHRGENQQRVITAIIDKLDSSNSYLLRVPEILNIAADSFETTFTREDVAEMLRTQLGKQTDWKVESISVDGTSAMKPTYSMGANWPLYVMEPNTESLQKAKDKINSYLTEK